MSFKVGQKIRVIAEDNKGEIIQIKGKQVIILNEFGFEESYHFNDIILDEDLIVQNIKAPKEHKHPLKKTIKPKEKIRTIDLHFGQLVDYPESYRPHEKLQLQLNAFIAFLNESQRDNIEKVICIHGHGKGVLKERVYQILKERKLYYYDADFRRYKLGATEIQLKTKG